MDRLVVAGGGIGGVAAALALARKNIPTIVLEQAAELGRSAQAFGSRRTRFTASIDWELAIALARRRFMSTG